MKAASMQAMPALSGRVRPDPSGVSAISAQQLALTQLRVHLTDWMRHEPGARRGTKPEELHQLRVAVRRIEATLGLLRHQLPSRLLSARKSAKGVLRGLGAARDLDVQLAELRAYCAKLPAAERVAAAPLEARLEAERTRVRARMLGMLDSEATRHWLETLNLATADLSTADSPDAPRAAIVVPERVRARYRKLKKAVRSLDARSSMEAYHLVRRRAKQLRYAIECGSELFGKSSESMLKSLRRLQDGLGAQQDAYIGKLRLASLAADGASLPPETLFLMGRLAEHHLDETRKAHKTLTRTWRKVRGRRWKGLRACMQELRDAASEAEPEAPSTDPPAALPAEAAPAPAPASGTLRH
jgi:CHAD domain-containing protein